jgi:hypothetical protein
MFDVSSSERPRGELFDDRRTDRSRRGRWGVRILVCVVFSVILLSSIGGTGAAAQSGVTKCTTIDGQGTQILSSDLYNATTTSCINLTASDVTVNGQGHTIAGNDTFESVGINVTGISGPSGTSPSGTSRSRNGIEGSNG